MWEAVHPETVLIIKAQVGLSVFESKYDFSVKNQRDKIKIKYL